MKNRIFISSACFLPWIQRTAAIFVTFLAIALVAATAKAVTAGTPAFARDASGHLPLYYLPVILTNNQNSPTPETFQCLLTIDSIAYRSYEAGNLSNINFQMGDGRTILHSWLESGEMSSSRSTRYWVVLPHSIAGSGGSATIYVVFYEATLNSKDPNVTGAEPAWPGGPYARYDNGSEVFEYYQRFGGLTGGTLPNGWERSPRYISVNDQSTYTNLTFTNTSFDGAAYAEQTPPSVTTYPTVIETRAGFPTGGAGNNQAGYAQVIGDFDPGAIGTGNWSGTAMVGTGRADNGAAFFWGSGSSDHFPYTDTSWNADPNVHVFTLNIDTRSLNSLLVDYSAELGPAKMTIRQTHAFGAYGGASLPGNGQLDLYWIRTRAYPPGAIFPSASFGRVSAVGVATGPASAPPIAKTEPNVAANSPLPGRASTGNIHSVDFLNFDYPTDCREQFGGFGKIIHVSGGKWSKENVGYFGVGKPGSEWMISYGDLKGDGQEEAVVVTSCQGQTNFDYEEIFVFAMSSNGPTLLKRLSPKEWGDGTRIYDVRVENRQLVVRYLNGGSHACPDTLVKPRFRWNGDSFDLIGSSTSPYDCNQRH